MKSDRHQLIDINEAVEWLPHHIGINIGTYYSGMLTTRVPEDDQQRLLQPAGAIHTATSP
jgi:hypothetical protein